MFRHLILLVNLIPRRFPPFSATLIRLLVGFDMRFSAAAATENPKAHGVGSLILLVNLLLGQLQPYSTVFGRLRHRS